MPIQHCTLPDGKPGFKYGDSGKCYKDGRDAAKQGIAIDGPDKFKKVMKSESGMNLVFAKAALEEYYSDIKVEKNNSFKSIANFLKADDGQVDSDTDRGDMLDCNAKKDEEIVDNAGDLSGNPSKTGDGLATGSVNGTDPNRGPVGKDDYGKDGKNDGDGDEPDPAAKADLDTPTKKVGSHTVVPPYNKDASPETDPDKKVPNVDTPSRDDVTAHEQGGRKTLDPKLQYKVKSESSNDDEDMGSDGPDTMGMGEKASAWMNACAYVSEEVRKNTPDENCAGPPGTKSFPINSGKDVEDASRLVGHSPNPSNTKKRIIEIAHRLGYQDHLPQSWRKPEHQTAYELALSLYSMMSPEAKKKLNAKLNFEENAVNQPDNSNS